MNPRHFTAFLRLRWRIRMNQLRKGGVANVVLLTLIYLVIAGLGVLMFVGGLLVGSIAMGSSPTRVVLYAWDGVVVVFLFIWGVGLLSDLQRSDALTLDKFLHLPVSPTGAFVINYLSSLINVTLILFTAGMLGLAIGLVLSRGSAMLILLPLLFAFLLALTAVTHQFQGWLTSLMANPRRRRTIIVLLTGGFILLIQVPNLINITRVRSGAKSEDKAQLQREMAEAGQLFAQKKLTDKEYNARLKQINDNDSARRDQQRQEKTASTERFAYILNVCLPPGWLPLGAAGAAEGDFLPALLGTLGLGLIGTASLWRGYKTTLRIYTGHYTIGTTLPQPSAAPVADAKPAKRSKLLQRQLPWLPEQAQAVALSGLQSLLRAPEAKMVMLSPLIMAVVFGGVTLSSDGVPPPLMRPLIALGAMVMTLVMMSQLAVNQFGIDRAGFRVFVLCPAPRWQILLGKNAAFAPLPLVWGLLMFVGVGIIYPMRFDHALALLPQSAGMFLAYCVLGNFLSIFAPIPMAQGSFKPAGARLVPVLLNLVGLMATPLLLGPFMLPVGVQFVAERFWGLGAWPINLALSLVLFAITLGLYLLMIRWQGSVLQQREQAILKVVTSKE